MVILPLQQLSTLGLRSFCFFGSFSFFFVDVALGLENHVRKTRLDFVFFFLWEKSNNHNFLRKAPIFFFPLVLFFFFHFEGKPKKSHTTHLLKALNVLWFDVFLLLFFSLSVMTSVLLDDLYWHCEWFFFISNVFAHPEGFAFFFYFNRIKNPKKNKRKGSP